MGNQKNRGVKPPRYLHKKKDNLSLWYRWHGIKKRCLNENNERFHQYGGRGIEVCAEWLESFDNFAEWALSNGYEEHLTLERIDVNGDYCPKNCKWIPRSEQAFNKRDTKWVYYKGERIQLKILCERLGVTYDTVHDRIYKRGWSVEDAVERPSYRENSLMSKCRARGINYGTVRDRINKLGWSEEEALNTPCEGRHVKVVIHQTKMPDRVCPICGTVFTPKMSRQKYCCEQCHAKSHLVRYKAVVKSRAKHNI